MEIADVVKCYTRTRATISSKSILTSTTMSADSIGAVCIHVTAMDPFVAFIDIYNRDDTFCMLRLKVDKTRGTPVISSAFNTLTKLSQFTRTRATIFSKAFLTSTVMSANSVDAVCIHVTVMVTGDAFIDIYIAND